MVPQKATPLTAAATLGGRVPGYGEPSKFKNLVYSGSQGKSSLVAAPPAPVDIPGKSLIGAFCYELFPGASSDLLTCRNL
ncbi:hypothetical protein Bca52824_045115 [Brassica carinata]|uniref:Uncharacterized protein n=1 Tax=Brassica carinata TaxID=52824 RepID=A0A8X7UPW9_BRACI|nr:hypothetical protein Bca52824_045115 [Brassica carinata]